MKTISLFASLLLCACALRSAPFVLTWSPSPDDAGAGTYICTALPTNAPSINAQIPLATAPAGSTNALFDSTNCPTLPCFLFVTFNNGVSNSVFSAPVLFDTAAFVVAAPQPRPIPKPPVVYKK